MFFLNLLTCESESPPQAFFFPICERTEEEPALTAGSECPWQCHIPWKSLLVATSCWETPESASCMCSCSAPGCSNQQLQFLNPWSNWSGALLYSCCSMEESRAWKPEKQQVGGGTAGVVHCSEIIYLLFCVRELMDEQS